ncbi:MAG: hypothetical protein OCD02_03180 [Spirochaetaceae bacterium]
MENIIDIDKLKHDIETSSPLELGSLLIESELHDMKEAQTIIEEVYAEFEKDGGSITESVVKPTFLGLADGVIRAFKLGGKSGVTASRILNECENFTYSKSGNITTSLDSYSEEINQRDFNKEFTETERSEYIRKDYENKHKMDNYKNNKSKDGNINDEYEIGRVLSREHNASVNNSAESDHIVPLKDLFNQTQGNYLLSENDIKEIANSEYNLAVTSRQTNNEKRDDTNKDYVKNDDKAAHLNNNDKNNMIKLGKNAQKQLNNNMNKAVLKNVINDKESQSVLLKNAKSASKDAALGNVVLFMIKPLFYEVNDCFKNGLEYGVGLSSKVDALVYRFSRVKDFVLIEAEVFLKGEVLNFIKNIIKSIISAIISCLVGMLKQVVRLIKEGFKIISQAFKILKQPNSQLSKAKKGDAILKLIAASSSLLIGVGVEALLNKVGITEPLSIILSSILTALITALLLYFFDSMDFFSVKAEKRHNKIQEIFNNRIKEIQSNTASFNTTALKKLAENQLRYKSISNSINKAVMEKDYTELNINIDEISSSLQINLPFTTSDQFIDYLNQNNIVYL